MAVKNATRTSDYYFIKMRVITTAGVSFRLDSLSWLVRLTYFIIARLFNCHAIIVVVSVERLNEADRQIECNIRDIFRGERRSRSTWAILAIGRRATRSVYPPNAFPPEADGENTVTTTLWPLWIVKVRYRSLNPIAGPSKSVRVKH